MLPHHAKILLKQIYIDDASTASIARSMFVVQDLKEMFYWNSGHKNPQTYFCESGHIVLAVIN